MMKSFQIEKWSFFGKSVVILKMTNFRQKNLLYMLRKRFFSRIYRDGIKNVIHNRDDKDMTSMKIVQFSRPPTPHVHLRPKFFHILELGRPISNEPPSLCPPSPNDNQSVKRKHNPRMTVKSFLQVGFRFQYQLIAWLMTHCMAFLWLLFF